MKTAKVYKCKPLVKGFRSKQWCCVWRTPRMPASSFWYFKTKREATEAMDVILGN